MTKPRVSFLAGTLLLASAFSACQGDGSVGARDSDPGQSGSGGAGATIATGGRASGGAGGQGGARTGGQGGASNGAGRGGGNPITGGSAGRATGGGSSTGGSAAGGATGAWSPTFINGLEWADTLGKPIQAHGGGILKVGDDYYWFGENRNGDSTFLAVSAYRSRDLRTWEFRNDVLKMSSAAELKPANIERPKVVYNASTKKYVMWMHWENGQNYADARAAVAVSDKVDGDYTYLGSARPLVDGGVTDHGKPGYMSRDCTLFVDDDGKAYFISATNENTDLNVYLLSEDYLSVDKLAATIFKGSHREAPVVFKRNDTYFLLSSAATGWDPNQTQVASSQSITSGWSSLSNLGDSTTFYSQPTYVLAVSGATGTEYLYLGDRWAGAWSGRVNDSTYLWAPLTFSSANKMSMGWVDTLTIDPTAGTVRGAVTPFRFMNKLSGKYLDVAGGSTESGAAVVQNAKSGGTGTATSTVTSQDWKIDYDTAGYQRLVNKKSSKVLEVPSGSTADGAALDQASNTGGDHQSWLILDLGGGAYWLKNKKSGKYLSVAAGATADGATVVQRASAAGDEQIWLLTPST